jgi:hypothetical protein
MELDSQFILQKEVNWSLLNHGLPIPVSVWNLFHAWDASILNHGASRQIKIMIVDHGVGSTDHFANF